MSLDVVQIVCELVSRPSVNPMGRAFSGPTYLEYQVTEYLENLFRQWKVPWRRQRLEPQRDNILARWDGDRPDRPVVVLEVHQDTVPVDGMTIPPFEPEVRQQRVYGRGACDIKGGMAAMLHAFARLVHDSPIPRPTVVLACSVNEEYGFSGAAALAQLLVAADDSWLPACPVAVVVAEPTMMDVVVAHKGACRWRCRTAGRAAHSSRPELGDNAIYRMARVVSALERYQEQLSRGTVDPGLGRATLNVGLIEGGLSVNTVPDECLIEIDRRLLPGETPEAAWEEAVRAVAEQHADPLITHDSPYIGTIGLSDQHNRALAQRLAEVCGRVAGAGQQITVPYGTDAPAFSALGLPTVVCGPGSIDQAHTVDEWVAVEQLQLAAEVYYQFLRSWVE